MVCDMILTTVFMTLILLCVWRRAWTLAAAFFGMFFTIEVAFLSASVLKVRFSRNCCSSSLIGPFAPRMRWLENQCGMPYYIMCGLADM